MHHLGFLIDYSLSVLLFYKILGPLYVFTLLGDQSLNIMIITVYSFKHIQCLVLFIIGPKGELLLGIHKNRKRGSIILDGPLAKSFYLSYSIQISRE